MLTIDKRVKKIVSEQLGVEMAHIRNDSILEKDLGVDSLDTVELLLALEDEFKMDILDEKPEKLLSVQDVINYISSRFSLLAVGL